MINVDICCDWKQIKCQSCVCFWWNITYGMIILVIRFTQKIPDVRTVLKSNKKIVESQRKSIQF